MPFLRITQSARTRLLLIPDLALRQRAVSRAFEIARDRGADAIYASDIRGGQRVATQSGHMTTPPEGQT